MDSPYTKNIYKQFHHGFKINYFCGMGGERFIYSFTNICHLTF